MSISGDSWHKVSAEASADDINDNEPQQQEQQQEEQQQQQQPDLKAQKERKLIVSGANVEEGSGGLLRQTLGGLTLFFVVAVWVVGVSGSSRLSMFWCMKQSQR